MKNEIQSATAQILTCVVLFPQVSLVRTISVMLELISGLVINSTIAHYGMEMAVAPIVNVVPSITPHGSTRAWLEVQGMISR